MPRSKTILQNEFPYHVTARCINKQWFSIPMESVWDIVTSQLFFINWSFEIKIHAFVLMNNHLHLLISTPQSNLNQAMNWFMRETTRTFNKISNRINQAWGGPYFRCIVNSHHYYLNAYKYIYANPTVAGLTDRCEDYKYSSLHSLLGKSHLPFPMAYDETLFSDIDSTLEWLNKTPNKDSWAAVEKALGKSQFKLPRSKNGKKQNTLEINLL